MHTPPWFTIVSFNFMAALIPLSALTLWRKPALWPYLFSLFNGLLVAFIDISAGEVQVPALLLAAFTFFTGFASPRRAWRWGIITGVWVPAFEIARVWLGVSQGHSISETAGSFLAIGFAFVGAYGGSLIRKGATGSVSGEHSVATGSTTGEGKNGGHYDDRT
jgi:hypothetical protein